MGPAAACLLGDLMIIVREVDYLANSHVRLSFVGGGGGRIVGERQRDKMWMETNWDSV